MSTQDTENTVSHLTAFSLPLFGHIFLRRRRLSSRGCLTYRAMCFSLSPRPSLLSHVSLCIVIYPSANSTSRYKATKGWVSVCVCLSFRSLSPLTRSSQGITKCTHFGLFSRPKVGECFTCESAEAATLFTVLLYERASLFPSLPLSLSVAVSAKEKKLHMLGSVSQTERRSRSVPFVSIREPYECARR